LTWLEKFLECTEEMEAPKSYYFWSALATVSAVIKDNIYINRGGAFKLYPNIYVLLYGPSGVRKGHPIALAKQLATAANCTRVISGRSSIQGIIQKLSEADIKEGREGSKHRTITDSAGFIVASEFSSSLIKDPMALTILTDLFDRHYHTDDYDNILKSGMEKLSRPTITMLGGANEEQFKDTITIRDALGGFIGRTFVISEGKRGKLNSLFENLKHPPDVDKLSEYLTLLSYVKGEITYEHSVGVYYDEWYHDYFKEDINDSTGSALRILESMLKVALLLSMSEDEELKLDKGHIDKAIELVEPLVVSAQKTVLGHGKSSLANQTAAFLVELLSQKENKCSRKIMLAKHWRDFNAEDCDSIARTLEEAHAITRSVDKNMIYYILTTEAATELEGKLK
jgi:hypothetical protein